MISETDPREGAALRQAQRFMSVLQDDEHRRSTESFTATDETETVTVVVNGGPLAHRPANRTRPAAAGRRNG